VLLQTHEFWRYYFALTIRLFLYSSRLGAYLAGAHDPLREYEMQRRFLETKRENFGIEEILVSISISGIRPIEEQDKLSIMTNGRIVMTIKKMSFSQMEPSEEERSDRASLKLNSAG
jgi:hypothetical protein